MRWETAVAIVLAPFAAELLRRRREGIKPFDGSWTFVRVLEKLRIGQQAEGSGPHEGRKLLPHLPAPGTGEVISEQSAVEGTTSASAETGPDSNPRP